LSTTRDEQAATFGGPPPARAGVTSQAAHQIADAYLLDHVGDMFVAGAPELSDNGRWIVPIILAYMRRGELGVVGSIQVDAVSGEVLFTEDDRQGVEARARLLAEAPSP
jgi:hypothetical protein